MVLLWQPRTIIGAGWGRLPDFVGVTDPPVRPQNAAQNAA